MSELRTEERELEELIQQSPRVVAVFLTEPFHPGAQLMAERLRSLMYAYEELQLIELTFTTYRRWARHYEVYGTPTLLIFREGKVKRHLPGVYTEEKLEEELRQLF